MHILLLRSLGFLLNYEETFMFYKDILKLHERMKGTALIYLVKYVFFSVRLSAACMRNF